jgi:hypothetical protein
LESEASPENGASIVVNDPVCECMVTKLFCRL